MAIIIVQQPDTLSLSGNLKDLVVQTDSALQVTLSTGSDTVLDETYYPGNGNLVHLNFSDVINAYLAYSLPNTDIYLQTKLSAAFTVSLTNHTDNKTLSFSAIKGGKLHLNESASQFLKGNFLTWQPIQKQVTYYSPEWLTYYAPSACSIILKAYWEDGSTSTKTLVSPSAGYCYSINLQYAVVSGMFDGKRPMYYDVWVESGGARLTYVQRYVASELQSDNEHWFLFENSLGGMDSVRAYGSQTDDPDYDYHMALRGNEGENYRIDVERVRSVNTGYLTPEETRWLQDLFATRKAYVYTATGLYPIVLTAGEGATEGDDEPSSFSFGYRFADVRPYLDIQRRTDLPENLTIPVPTGETFFLPPRLAEFPKQALSPDLLIPVEEPHTEAWGTLTAGMLYDSVLNGLIAYLEGLTVQPYYQNLIKVGDTTSPTDLNVFSAARTLKEIEALAGSSKPSSLWLLDKSEEYFHLSEDGLNALLRKNFISFGDVVAYSTKDFTPTLPIASPSNYGLVKYDGVTLKIDDDGRLYVSEGGSGSGSGISNVLSSGTGNAVTSLSFDPSTNILTYNLGATFLDKTALDNAMLRYVTIDTDQTITGQKTFTKDVLSNQDVIAYAIGENLPSLPISSYDTYGLVKIDNVTIKEDDRGRIYVASGGSSGIDFTVGSGLELTTDNYLNVLFGTTSNTACAGNDARLSDARRNPYSLSWSGYSSGSYNGSSAASITIPSNTNQLTNGAGYIKDNNGIIKTLYNSGYSDRFLAGDGYFRTISYSSLSDKPDLSVYVTLNTDQTITASKTFAKTVLSNQDVVAYGTSVQSSLPIASDLVYGIVKYDNSTIKVNSSGQLYTEWIVGKYTKDSLTQIVNSGNAGLKFWNNINYTGCKLGGGNGLVGYSGSENTIGNLYLNYISSTTNVVINNAGNITYNSATQRSDMRLKTKINTVSDVLDSINNLDVFYFTWNYDTTKKLHIGVSAQQVQLIYPELVQSIDVSDQDTSAISYLSVDYATLGTCIAIQGVKELYRHYKGIENSLYSIKSWGKTKDDQILYLQKRVDELQSELDVLKGGAA